MEWHDDDDDDDDDDDNYDDGDDDDDDDLLEWHAPLWLCRLWKELSHKEKAGKQDCLVFFFIIFILTLIVVFILGSTEL